MADRVPGRKNGKQLGSKESDGRLRSVVRRLAAPPSATTPALSPPPAEASTIQLVEAAVKETRELVRVELELAKLEAKQQLKAVMWSAIAFGLAALLAVVTLTLLAVAVVLALG
ncbi:MAG: hypothetical protein H6Q89_5463, partial [Myxococcaceae bacterium]|nr:hypothetical protein [Myxococcaceae bacterium]